MDCGVIVGSMLIFNGAVVQVRGDAGAVAFLLSNLQLENVNVQVPVDCEDLLLAKYPTPLLKEHITLMTIKRGEEHLNFSLQPKQLVLQDASAVVKLMHQCYPEMWSDITTEDVSSKMAAKEAVWLGIKAGGELAAFGYATKMSRVSHLTWIATSPSHQRRGYASSIFSALLKEVLSYSEAALIYVDERNIAAKHIYASVGFKPHTQYFYAKNRL